MNVSPHILAVLPMWLLAAGVLRALAVARRADDVSDRYWTGLSQLQSRSGVAFFATAHAPAELGTAIGHAVERARARRFTPARASRRAAAPHSETAGHA